MASKAKFVSMSAAEGDLVWLNLDGPDFVCTGKWIAERGVKPVHTVNVSGFEVAFLIHRGDAAILLGLE